MEGGEVTAHPHLVWKADPFPWPTLHRHDCVIWTPSHRSPYDRAGNRPVITPPLYDLVVWAADLCFPRIRHEPVPIQTHFFVGWVLCTPSDASGPPRVCWDTVGEPLASRWCSPARPTGAGGDVPGGLGGCRPRRLCGRQRPAAQASRPTWQLWQLAGMAATVANTPRRCRRWTLRLPQPPHRQRAPARGSAGRRQPRAEARRPLVWAAPAQPTVDYGRRCGALPCPSCCSRPPRPSATRLSPFSGPSPFHEEPTPPPLRILSSRVRLPQPSVGRLLPASPTGADQQRPQAATARCQSVCQVAPGAGVRHEVSSRHAPAALVSRPAPKDWASKGPSLPVPLRPAPSPPHQARGPPKGARRAGARTPRQSRPGSVGGSGRRQTARWHPPPHTQRPVRGSHP